MASHRIIFLSVKVLQQEWSRIQEMTPLIVEYVKQHPKWRVSLQTHKYMEIP
jgi:7-carboxy-7-deazaguanine synthase